MTPKILNAYVVYLGAALVAIGIHIATVGTRQTTALAEVPAIDPSMLGNAALLIVLAVTTTIGTIKRNATTRWLLNVAAVIGVTVALTDAAGEGRNRVYDAVLLLHLCILLYLLNTRATRAEFRAGANPDR